MSRAGSGPFHLVCSGLLGGWTSLRAFCVTHTGLDCDLPPPRQLGLSLLAWRCHCWGDSMKAGVLSVPPFLPQNQGL